MSTMLSAIWAFFATMLAPVGAAARWFHYRWIKWIPAAGKPAKGRIFYPPLPDINPSATPLSAIKAAWAAVSLRSASLITVPVDGEGENQAFRDLDSLTKRHLELAATTGAIAKQSRSKAPHEARGRASGVTRKENLQQEIADHVRQGDDMDSHHAAESVIGTVFMAMTDGVKDGTGNPFRGVSKSGKPATDGTVLGYFMRTAAMLWSMFVNGRARGVKRDADGIALNSMQEKAVGLTIDPVGREQDPAVVAEETDPDMVKKIQDLVEMVMGGHPEDILRLWACGIRKIEGVKPWRGIRSMKDAYIMRRLFLDDLALVLECYRGPAVAEALERAADKYAG